MTETIQPKEFLIVSVESRIQNKSKSYINWFESTVQPNGSEGYGYEIKPNAYIKYSADVPGNDLYLYNPNSIPCEVQV